MDLAYNIHKISLNSEGIKTLMLIAAEEFQFANKWALAVQPQHHMQIANLFASFGKASLSLQLSGLTLMEKVCFFFYIFI